MSNTINAQKAGVVFGSALGLWHFVWAILVAIGLAQPLLDAVLHLHMLSFSYIVLPFSLSSSAMLVVLTAVMGYVIGYVVAWLWNAVQK